MRTLTIWSVLFAALVLGRCLPSTAQIINSGFETQYPNTPPSREKNIRDTSGDTRYLDELPNWVVPVAVNTPSTPYGPVNATFFATNGSMRLNQEDSYNLLAGEPFFAHNQSIGCVALKREYPGAGFRYDGMVMQRIQTPLIPGHLYQASFWTLKVPASTFKSKMAISIVKSSSAPTFDGNTNVNSILPAPYSIISSDYIASNTGWTQVAGSFVAGTLASGESTWIVVGYDRSQAIADNPNNAAGPFDNYAIDDISLVDMGCAPNPTPTLTIESQSDCDRVAGILITNFNPSLTYTTRATGNTRAVYAVNYRGWFQLVGPPQGNGYSGYTVTASSSCSTTTSTVNAYVQFGTCYRYRAYPNPANEEISVYQDGSPTESTAQRTSARTTVVTTKAETVASITVRLYDGYGRLRQEQHGSAQTGVRLSTVALPVGLYVLHILQDNEVVSRQQLQVQH